MVTGGEGEEGRQLTLKDPTLLLSACPSLTIWSWDSGIALHPLQAPPGLMLLWYPQQPSQLQVFSLSLQPHLSLTHTHTHTHKQPFILNSHSPVAPSPANTHYPRLCLQLAPLWTRVCWARAGAGGWLLLVLTLSPDSPRSLDSQCHYHWHTTTTTTLLWGSGYHRNSSP